MALDITKVIGAVSRELDTVERDGSPAKRIVATRVYDTAIDDLWDTLTNGERIPRWFLPITGDLRLGGRYQFEGNAGGTILECAPPERLGVTWEYAGQVSWVNVTLTAAEGTGTSLRLEHIAHVPPEFWDQFGPGAVGVGWDSGLLGLDQYFATDASVSPETAMAWMMSEEGKEFVRQSSDSWLKAHVAAGADPAEASAAAERTRAAYTGEAPES